MSVRSWMSENKHRYKNDKHALFEDCANETGTKYDSVRDMYKKIYGSYSADCDDKIETPQTALDGSVSILDFVKANDVTSRIKDLINDHLKPIKHIIPDESMRAHLCVSEKKWPRVRDKESLTPYRKRMSNGKIYWGHPDHLKYAYDKEEVL